MAGEIMPSEPASRTDGSEDHSRRIDEVIAQAHGGMSDEAPTDASLIAAHPELMPELAPILIGALIGLVMWLFTLDALADKRIADYLQPDTERCDCRAQEQFRNQQRREWQRARQRADDMEMRQIRIEQNQWMQRHGQ